MHKVPSVSQPVDRPAALVHAELEERYRTVVWVQDVTNFRNDSRRLRLRTTRFTLVMQRGRNHSPVPAANSITTCGAQ